jgi:hypothetical protein
MSATNNGVQVIVRYVTRAPARAHVRSRLNHAIVELLHQSSATSAGAPAVSASTAAAAAGAA